MTEAAQYEHINLNEVDDSRSVIDEGVYTFEVNKLEPTDKLISNSTSDFVGQTVLVLKGSYTIVDDPKYSGRKIWADFWTPFKAAQVNLKKQMIATGVNNEPGESLREYGAKFATLNPPARFQALLRKKKDKRDPDGPDVNEISFYSAKPV